jgi:hypothetical protein
MTLKMTVKFEQDGKLFRSMVVEGSESDIAHALVALDAEWEKHLPQDEQVPSMLLPPTDDEVQAAMLLSSELRKRYGPEVFGRMEVAMETAFSGMQEKFFNALKSGEMTLKDLPGFVLASVRAEFLNVLPDFPEALLDRVVEASAAPLNAQFELLMQHHFGGRS